MERLATQWDVRAAFWRECGHLPGVTRRRGRDGDYLTDTRCTFADFVDTLARDGRISERLAERVTL